MKDQDRRTEILQAESAIRQLAEELAQARQSRITADEVLRVLEAAHASLEQTREVLSRAVQALTTTSDSTQAAFSEARSQLGSLEEQIAGALADLRGVTKQLEGFTVASHKLVDQSFEKVVNVFHGAREDSQKQAEMIGNRLRSLSRLVWPALVFTVLAFGGTVACFLRLLKK